jgi:Holliday junction DNA helicase RuvA
MIALLTGRPEHVTETTCIVDVAGVGYLVNASRRTLESLPRLPATVRLLIETHVREDAILLYGFADVAERDWFRLLLTIQGVGGKVALSILSAISPHDLNTVIASGDRSAMLRVPGVGPRLAARLATELKDKVGAASAGSLNHPVLAEEGSPSADAVSALMNLGYRRQEARAAVSRVTEVLGPQASLDLVIREALKEIAGRNLG